ncbi:zf-TFIIB domain-containing protein [Treponema sp.]|uniref:zf-TFIIB domain-containing protein n=1 Tax=Treponema sp. TaxID=166 RepID=UPI00388D7952
MDISIFSISIHRLEFGRTFSLVKRTSGYSAERCKNCKGIFLNEIELLCRY